KESFRVEMDPECLIDDQGRAELNSIHSLIKHPRRGNIMLQITAVCFLLMPVTVAEQYPCEGSDDIWGLPCGKFRAGFRLNRGVQTRPRFNSSVFYSTSASIPR